MSIAGILLLACVLVQQCASQRPLSSEASERRLILPPGIRPLSAEASERRLTAPPGDCFLVPYEYDNGNVIHSTLFCSRGVLSNTGACITSLFKSCDITQSPGIVFGIDAKREYFVQEGNTEHWISFYDDPASGSGLCIYYTLEDCHGETDATMMSTNRNGPPG